jgi:hypothetical protein
MREVIGYTANEPSVVESIIMAYSHHPYTQAPRLDEMIRASTCSDR